MKTNYTTINTSNFKTLSSDCIDYVSIMTREQVKKATGLSISELVMIDIKYNRKEL